MRELEGRVLDGLCGSCGLVRLLEIGKGTDLVLYDIGHIAELGREACPDLPLYLRDKKRRRR